MIKDLLMVATVQNPAFRRLGGEVVERATVEDATASSTLRSLNKLSLHVNRNSASSVNTYSFTI